MKYFNVLKSTTLVLFFIFIACDSVEEVPDVLMVETCSDEGIESFFSECRWFPFSAGDNSISGLSIDFSNNNILVYNTEGAAVDEGNWSIKNGIISLNALSAVMANYIGDWQVIECREGFVELQKGEVKIGLEKACNP